MVLANLELKTGFTGGFGKCLHPAMILVVAPIELSGFDPRFGGSFSDEFTNQCRSVTVATSFHLIANALVTRAGTGNRFALLVIDDLASEMLERTVNAQPGLIGVTTQLVTNMTATAKSLRLNFLIFIHDDAPMMMIIW
tara:strand:+ start:224 stop:640 length:417 start_codon:yes stop_codon:yes gene_type:complete